MNENGEFHSSRTRDMQIHIPPFSANLRGETFFSQGSLLLGPQENAPKLKHKTPKAKSWERHKSGEQGGAAATPTNHKNP